jgi:hypothetical protein
MKNMLVVVGMFFIFFILAVSDFGQSSDRVYDCSLAEISADIPKEVKEECRRRYHEEWRKNNANGKYQT